MVAVLAFSQFLTFRSNKLVAILCTRINKVISCMKMHAGVSMYHRVKLLRFSL